MNEVNEVNGETYRTSKLNFDVYSNFISPKIALNLQNQLDQLPWKTLNRRSTLLFGEDVDYVTRYWNRRGGYNVQHRRPKPWSELSFLKTMKKNVEAITNETFTVCAIQRYPSGKYGINRHQDKEMKDGTTIAGVSIGQKRTFRLSNFRNQTLVERKLRTGSLYVMNPPTNSLCFHEVLKDQTEGVRYSLTFRNY